MASGAAVLALAAAGLWYFWPHAASSSSSGPPSAPLPALSTSPFLNTRPGVGYVGDEACAACHVEESKSYRRHPMGQSLFSALDFPPIEKYDQGNPFQAGRFHFQVLHDGRKLIHKEWCLDHKGNVVAQEEAEIKYVVGSGSQGLSYLIERDGFLFQSPITWYSSGRAKGTKSDSVAKPSSSAGPAPPGSWGLSPGYERNQSHFQRLIEPRCLYCHSHEARPVKDTINRYHEPIFGQMAIGCERCHGPGQLHVAPASTATPSQDADYTIVNPRRLPATLRDAVCEQCHLQGEDIVIRRGRSQADYRPGLPLHEYVAIFVRPPEAHDVRRIVGHVEQMHQSACYNKSAGKFGCISCHDPHRLPPAKEKASFYRQRCLTCHAEHEQSAELQARSPQRPALAVPGLRASRARLPSLSVNAPACSLPKSTRIAKNKEDSCVTCHMPSLTSTSASHVAITDHRVLRRPDDAVPHPDLAPGNIALEAFHRQLMAGQDEELSRDEALATISLAVMADHVGDKQAAESLSYRALPSLEKAQARDPDDLPVPEARGFALFAQGRSEEALKVLQDVLAKAPNRERALSWAAAAAESSQQLDLARQYAGRLVENYPYFAGHHHRLALIQTKRGAWPDALGAAERAVKTDPFRPESRGLLITVLLETGDQLRAQAEFDHLAAIAPDYQEKLRPWFNERVRSRPSKRKP